MIKRGDKMPYINLEISKKIESTQKEELKDRLAEILLQEGEKPEEYFMFSLSENREMWFRGKKSEVIYIELKYVGEFSLIQKEKITERACNMCSKVTGIMPENIYITFQEIAGENWGNSGKTFA